MTGTAVDGTVHVFIHDEGDAGVWVTSPQLPGFSFFRATSATAKADLGEALRYAAEGTPLGDVQLHYELHRERADGSEYILRIAEDRQKGHRVEVGQRVEGVLSNEDIAEASSRTARTATGEVVYVCAVAGDRLSWVVGQMDDEDAIVLVLSVADAGIWTLPFSSGTERGNEFRSLAEWGWSEEMTLGELMHSIEAGSSAGAGVLVS